MSLAQTRACKAPRLQLTSTHFNSVQQESLPGTAAAMEEFLEEREPSRECPQKFSFASVLWTEEFGEQISRKDFRAAMELCKKQLQKTPDSRYVGTQGQPRHSDSVIQ